MNFRLILLLCSEAFLCLILACRDAPAQDATAPLVIIEVQAFSDADQQLVEHVVAELKKRYPSVEVQQPIALPSSAYYKPRKRYRADSLLAFLNHRTKPGHLTIALTGKDISWTKGAIKDYGIMGLGLCPGSSCVASSYRLSKTNTGEQLCKITLHELGHTQGLPHCPEAGCLMQDAEGKNHTNKLHDFCLKCKEHLRKKGWTL